MKLSFIIVTSVILNLPFFDQHQILGKNFLLVTEVVDGHFESLHFLTDSTCIHSRGSVSWGASSDTLNYTLLENSIKFKGINDSTGVLKNKGVEIEYYSQKQIKDDMILSLGISHFKELDASKDKVMCLKVK